MRMQFVYLSSGFCGLKELFLLVSFPLNFSSYYLYITLLLSLILIPFSSVSNKIKEISLFLQLIFCLVSKIPVTLCDYIC